jgi:hypothetical protein
VWPPTLFLSFSAGRQAQQVLSCLKEKDAILGFSIIILVFHDNGY